VFFQGIGDPVNPTDDSTFRHLVEQAPDGHFILVDGVFTYLNSAASRMFGWGDDPPEGLSVLEVIHPDDHERCQRNILLRQSGALRGATAYRGLRRNGELFPIEVHTVPMGSGGSVALHGIIRDLSDRKEMEDALVRTEQSALISRLVAGASHDLNNLLAIIQASADVLERGALDPDAAAAVERIQKAVRRSGRKVAQMKDLGLAHIEDQDPEPLYINSLIDGVLSLTRARWKDEAERAGIRYEISWNPGAPPPVRGCSGDLQAALVALVFNAIEAMPTGGRLTIETGLTAEGEVSIRVQDEGKGIEEPTLEDLSDVFYTTQPGRKIGLGLHLVRRVAEEAGGRLELLSKLGEGSVFTLVLPASDEVPAAPEAPLRFVGVDTCSLPTVPEPARPRTVGGRRILVVDDQADLLQVLRAILEEKGFEVDAALSAREGLAFVDSIKYSVILTDLGMPDMSGWEFAAEAKKRQPRTPVILMTGWGAEVDEQRLRDEGIYALLPKPFGGKQLLDLLADAFESRRQASQAPPA
jgi:PAS domain S-box-containing protein